MEPLKTATLWGMENWPSYGGGLLIEVIYLPTIECILSYFKLNIIWYATIYTINIYFTYTLQYADMESLDNAFIHF